MPLIKGFTVTGLNFTMEVNMDKAKYVRIYTDEAGESHFEDLETELIFTDFAPPAPPMAVAPFLPSEKMQWLGAPRGWPGDVPHPVPTRGVFVVTQGEVEVTTSDGDVRRFTAGTVVLSEDTWGKGHRSVVTSDIDVVILVISVAESETTRAIKP